MGAYINATSELKRKKWVREGLLQKTSQSFFAPYTSTKAENAIVYQVSTETASEGHTIVFDYDGNLASSAIKGTDTAFGKGEQKKKFSNKLTVERYRLVVDNGDAFDAVDVGDLSLSQHADALSKLGDLFTRFKDQAIFDALQGFKGTAPTHIIDLTATFDYESLLTIEETLKSGGTYSTGGNRRPLVPYKLANGNPVWLFIVDASMARKIKGSTNYKAMVFQGDVRGNDNRAISGVIGKIGNLLIVEADTFFGYTDSAATTWGLDKNSVEIAGLRKLDAAGKWTGQTGYVYTGAQRSRGLILGANAVQLGFGKMPDYKLQESTDFKIKSESALEVWMECQKTKLTAELAGDYAQAKVAGIDWGCIAVDVTI